MCQASLFPWVIAISSHLSFEGAILTVQKPAWSLLAHQDPLPHFTVHGTVFTLGTTLTLVLCVTRTELSPVSTGAEFSAQNKFIPSRKESTESKVNR